MKIDAIAERLIILSSSSLFEDRLQRIELLNELVVRLRVLHGLQMSNPTSENILIRSEILEVFLILNQEV